jgi:hypothetical protein
MSGVPFHQTPQADDWQWAFEQREKRAFEPYRGLHIAIHERKIIGACPPGPDSLTFADRVANFYGLDPARVVQIYVESPADILS